MTTLHIPDISQHQARVDLSKVGPAVILRAHNGYRADVTFASRRASARQHQQIRGFYGYVVADRDAATQGKEFAKIVGKLQPGEFAVCDLEAGTGDQSARAEAWCQAVDAVCGKRAWIYSGLSFRADHLPNTHGRRLWVAAYRSAEPGGAHTFWQHSDAEPHAGIGKCDCSVYHGSVADLLALIDPPVKAQVVAKPTPLPSAPPAWWTAPHKIGDVCQEVASIAKRLKASGRVTFDADLDRRVRYVQSAHHLPVTGVVDARTAIAIG